MNNDNTESVLVGEESTSGRSTMAEVPETVEVLEVDSSLKMRDKRVLEYTNGNRADSTDLGSDKQWS